MPQEGRCLCLFQATRKFEQLNIVNPRGQAARTVFSRVSAQNEEQSPSVSLSAFATSDVSQSKGVENVRRAVIADLVENLWQFILAFVVHTPFRAGSVVHRIKQSLPVLTNIRLAPTNELR